MLKGKIFLLIFSASFLILVGLFSFSEKENSKLLLRDSDGYASKAEISVNGKTIRVEIVRTPSEIIRGLSGREEIGSDGMLFIFDSTGFHSIWMKDMKFAIDILWIDENFRVIDAKKSVQPETFPETFRSIAPARYVLEVSAGFSEILGIKIGSQFNFGEIFSAP